MRSTNEHGRMLTVKNGAIRCPICGAMLQRVPPDMSARRLPVYCRRDKIEFSVNIEHGQILEDRAAAGESCET